MTSVVVAEEEISLDHEDEEKEEEKSSFNSNSSNGDGPEGGHPLQSQVQMASLLSHLPLKPLIEEEEEEMEPIVTISTTPTPATLNPGCCNGNGNGPPSTNPSSRAPSTTPCSNCQKVEEAAEIRMAQVKIQFETEIARLKKEVESATKTKESIVMKYAMGEMEVIKLKKSIENSDKLIKQLNYDNELASKKHKMLSSERERLSLMIDSKVHDIEDLQKEISRLNQECQSKDFKFTWTQNKLREETDAHSNTRLRLQAKIDEIEKELELAKQSIAHVCSNGELSNYKDDSDKVCESGDTENSEASSTCPPESELNVLREKNEQLTEDNTILSCKISILEKEQLDIQAAIGRLQESNSEHLHQIATLQSDLAATECLKIQLQKEKEMITVWENECHALRQAHTEILNDMSISRSKEAELLAYTQQVTEKNVILQSNFSSVEAKSNLLKDENRRLQKHVEKLESDIRELQQMMSKESKHQLEEKQTIVNDANSSKGIIEELQQKLDEARGEIGLLNRKLNSSVRELSKELHVVRKQVKDVHASDELSQSSRTSSSSSLTNGDGPHEKKQEETSTCHNSNEPECPVIPDQQVLIERIVKLQRMLAKKQDKLEFFQEHVKQLVESVQKKSKIIQAYAMSQDIDALSSNLAEQNRAEVLKHKGIMASVYGSKPADDTMTIDLSLEINRKLQVVLEDTLLRNITLKDSLNTLGKEISKLTETNHDLHNQLLSSSK